MSGPGATPLFIDTGAFYARADADDAHHRVASRLFAAIRSSEAPYRPLYTTHSVRSEFATLVRYKLGHDVARRTLNAILASASFTVVPVGRATFSAAADQFAAYDDQRISFVDHTSSLTSTPR